MGGVGWKNWGEEVGFPNRTHFFLGIHGGWVPGLPQISQPLHEMTQYLHVTCAHPLVYIKSSLHDLGYLIQHECCVSSCYSVLCREQ